MDTRKITREQLIEMMPLAKAKADIFITPLNLTMHEFSIDNVLRQSSFLAQLAHESLQLTHLEENLNYSADGLANTWPSRYAAKDAAGKYIKVVIGTIPKARCVPNDLAKRLHRNPQAIANNVYANRMGNGDEASGDGWRTRGSGFIQLTGTDNHNKCADYFGIERSKIGEWLRTPEGACRSAGWFWDSRNCNKLADAGLFDAVSDVVNIGRRTEAEGDSIGYADRLSFYQNMKRVLSCLN